MRWPTTPQYSGSSFAEVVESSGRLNPDQPRWRDRPVHQAAHPDQLQDLFDLEERKSEDVVALHQKQSLEFCALEVVLPSYECRSPGAGMAEEPLDRLEKGSGKMAVVHRPFEEITDSRTEEEVQDLIQL